jgi:hypothetical protein
VSASAAKTRRVVYFMVGDWWWWVSVGCWLVVGGKVVE